MDCFIGTIYAFGFNYAPVGFAFCDGKTVPFTQYQALYALIGMYYGGDGRTIIGLPNLQSRVPVGQYTSSSTIGNLTVHNIGATGGLENSAGKGTGIGTGTFTLTPAQVPLAAHTHPSTFTPTIGSQTVKIPGATGTLAVGVEVDVTTSASAGTFSGTTNQLSTLGKSYAAAGGTQTALAGVKTTVSGNASTGDINFTLNNLVTGGTAAVQANTATTASAVNVPVSVSSVSVPTVMPFLALNFCIALNGLWPDRP